MSGNNKSKTDRTDKIRKVMAGLQKHFGSMTLMLANASYAPAALQALLQSDIDANDASTSARAGWLQSVSKTKASNASVDPVLVAIHDQVLAAYGNSPDVGIILADFGYAPRKKVVLTAEQLAAKAAKLRATRAARGTVGPKKKAHIKGTVPATGAGASAAVTTTPAPDASNSSSSTSGSSAGASQGTATK